MKSSPMSVQTAVGMGGGRISHAGVQVLGLVPLAGGAGEDVIFHCLAEVGGVEIAVEVERALNALVAVIVHGGEHLVEQGRRRRNVEAVVERDEAVNERPGACSRAHRQLVLECHQRRVHGCGLLEAVDVDEAGTRDGQDRCLLRVVAGEGIRDRVRAPHLVLHREIEAE